MLILRALSVKALLAFNKSSSSNIITIIIINNTITIIINNNNNNSSLITKQLNGDTIPSRRGIYVFVLAKQVL